VKSTSQFDLLEEAIVSDWREPDLRDEMIDNGEAYERMIRFLMISLSVGVALSIMSVLYFALGAGGTLLPLSDQFRHESTVMVAVIGAAVGIGWEFQTIIKTLLSRTGRFLQDISTPSVGKHISTFTAKLSIFGVSVSTNSVSDLQTYLTQQENLSSIRARLLREIRATVGLQTWTFQELSDKLQQKEPDIGLTREMIHRLVDAGYIQQTSSAGPSTHVIRIRDNSIVDGQDLDKVIGDELRRLISYIEDHPDARNIVADSLRLNLSGSDIEPLKDALVSGSTTERMEKLNQAVQELKENPEVDVAGDEFGEVIFRQRANRYQLTPRGIRPFVLFQIQRAQTALADNSHIQATVLASKGLEEFLECLVRSEASTEDLSRNMGLSQLINLCQEHDLISPEHADQLHSLRKIRNTAVHDTENEGINPETAGDLIGDVESIVKYYS
jgi:hypothetical protein